MKLPPHAGAALGIAIAIAGAALVRGADAPARDPGFTPRVAGVVLTAGDEPAGDYVVHQELDELASLFAMRPYSIHCPTPEAWADDPWGSVAWGYTNLEWDYAVLDPQLCEALLDVGVEESTDDWARALAVSVLIHESYHGRRWGGRANEAKVECRAIRHWRVGMQLLGAGDEEIERLWPWALALHWRLARLADDYYFPSCEVPNPW